MYGGRGHDPDVANGLVEERTGQIEAQGDQPVLILVLDGGVEATEQAGGVCTQALPP